MDEEIIMKIKGKPVTGGMTEGEAIVSRMDIF